CTITIFSTLHTFYNILEAPFSDHEIDILCFKQFNKHTHVRLQQKMGRNQHMITIKIQNIEEKTDSNQTIKIKTEEMTTCSKHVAKQDDKHFLKIHTKLSLTHDSSKRKIILLLRHYYLHTKSKVKKYSRIK
ncbi:hypothetical protein ACJX0J_033338, partial [Zea mays]